MSYIKNFDQLRVAGNLVTTSGNIAPLDLANGTAGEVITWDAAGMPITVGPGLAGQALISNGAGAAPSFQTDAIGANVALSNLSGVAVNESLVSDTDITDDLGSASVRWNNSYAATVRTGDTDTDTVLFQARDVDGASWTTFATMTAANTPTFDLSTATTVGGSETIVTASSTDTLTNKTFDANGTGNSITNIETADIAGSAKTGADTTLVTGTAGTNGNISQWNADGDLVDASIATTDVVTPTSTHTFTNKTFDANGIGNSLSNVDVADLADGTDGELITWDAAGAPTTVATGNSGEVLTSNGVGAAPTFQATPGGVTTANFVFAYDTTSQMISTPDTFQDYTWSNNGQIDGWTHTVSTADFTCAVTGKYKVIITMNSEKTAGGTVEIGYRALFNGTEITGSYTGVDVTSNNTTSTITNQFIFDATATQVLKFEIAGSTTTVGIVPAPPEGSPTTVPSATLLIERMQ